MKIEYKQNLDHIVSGLKKVPDLFDRIASSSLSSDGRDTSKSGEDVVKDEIEKLVLPNSMEEEFAKPRHWYDYRMDLLPINIKISTGINADNAGSKLGVYVACTGHFPDNDPHMPKYFEMLKNGIDNPAANINDVDYVYLVFNRKTQHIHWIGARQLVVLQPNGKNQPYQINWSENIVPVDRDLESARKFLLSSFYESLRKASEPLIIFESHFTKFLEE